ASERLSTMHLRYGGIMPWPLTFSYSRAIQQPALEKWKGEDRNVEAAQKLLYHRAACNGAARKGEYNAELENTLA
ncbi:class I fructose-bisphosphate aldolase, partial [Salmonella enterica]|uniref:class I fructose-bisphosphate aldolase n=1 Tax=Salmonella enterica TaxID=28901 RepID=UPI0020C2814D